MSRDELLAMYEATIRALLTITTLVVVGLIAGIGFLVV
jgi:hypothetical protein